MTWQIFAAAVLATLPGGAQAMSALELSLRMGAPWQLHQIDAPEVALSSTLLLHVAPGGALVAAGVLECGASWHADLTGALPDLAPGPARLITSGCDGTGEQAAAAAFLDTLIQVRRFDSDGAGYVLVDAAGLPRLVLRGDTQP